MTSVPPGLTEPSFVAQEVSAFFGLLHLLFVILLLLQRDLINRVPSTELATALGSNPPTPFPAPEHPAALHCDTTGSARALGVPALSPITSIKSTPHPKMSHLCLRGVRPRQQTSIEPWDGDSEILELGNRNQSISKTGSDLQELPPSTCHTITH